ncbi:hypothetical protein [Streptomyces sp. NPDC029004]|uniref:hypothetical protein n=1 Tax=Streptomyces sp. NPDC029004 TaxID=3154490 RepID=UPI0033DDD757
MNDIKTETLGWDLIGWDSDEQAAHVAGLNRVEILRIRDLFPGQDDDFLETAVYQVPACVVFGDAECHPAPGVP